MTSLMRLIKIEDTENIKPFNCGNDDLNGFLLEDARFYREKLIANTFIMEDDDETIAFFSLLNDKISQTTIDKNYWRKLRKAFPHRKHLGSYPAVKIGRLGVATSHRGEGIGTDIISAVKQMLINRQSVSATRFLTVDAYLSAVPFYERNGFHPLINQPCEDTLPMYFDLIQLIE
ncbi:acetyltransferase, GNAT family [Bacteroides xylanisolvens SD CC 2a]|uniref:N-acetyltransferase domain-containing protein n=3 Tax=Bacteroides xylanisolvens TaxID=371601 RepID=D4VQW7_9BACE|nr:acetyltransferase, GNAT family [Bacteroides sp. 2_1_22]EFF55117.1 acetyltransferase, GNAT family [Bacteroides xylanisolvens SD CC 2a]EFG11763.1 acetyltransferase, GNAT family [Bacteroides xylanisolvens SD CC 1b]CDL99940.1 hypothetical protein BN891_28570 [Bacteroides xylanisolvens SD CC 2a]CDM04439.1 hypothetical protein BN890_20140 [Bacteroides xylanisolvens SD CC 1b]